MLSGLPSEAGFVPQSATSATGQTYTGPVYGSGQSPHLFRGGLMRVIRLVACGVLMLCLGNVVVFGVPQQSFQALGPGKAISGDQVAWDTIDTLTPTLAWAGVAASVGGYHVVITEVRGASGVPVYDKAGVQGTTFTVPAGALRDSVIYVWYVTTQDRAKGALTSTRRGFVVKPVAAPVRTPAPPQQLTVKVLPPSSRETKIQLFWTVAAAEADAFEIWLKRTDAGSYQMIESIPASSRGLLKYSYDEWQWEGRKEYGAVYYYRVRGKNKAGQSGWSNEVRIITPAKSGK